MRAALIALVLLLAGCVDETGGYILEAEGVPAEVAANETFEFHMEVTGAPERTSDHIGGHFWDASTDDPTGDFADQAGACAHLPGGGDIVSDHHIECQIDTPGTYYLRGHIRYEDDGETVNLWTDEHVITVTA